MSPIMKEIRDEIPEEIIEETRTETKIEAARNMFSQGVDADKIDLWLDLPIETVQQLAEQLKVSVEQ